MVAVPQQPQTSTNKNNHQLLTHNTKQWKTSTAVAVAPGAAGATTVVPATQPSKLSQTTEQQPTTLDTPPSRAQMLQQINNLVQQTQDIISNHWSSSLQQHLRAAIAQPTITTDPEEYGIPIDRSSLRPTPAKMTTKASEQPSNSRPPGSLHTCTPWTLPGIQSAMTSG